MRYRPDHVRLAHWNNMGHARAAVIPSEGVARVSRLDVWAELRVVHEALWGVLGSDVLVEDGA